MSRQSHTYTFLMMQDSRKWFYGEYAKIIGSSGIPDEEKLRLNGIALGAATMDYEYERAESIAEQLRGENNLPWQVYHNLIDFYTKTRQYATAEEIAEKAAEEYKDNEECLKKLEKIKNELEEQKKKAAEGKAEYLPNPKQNKEEVQKKYIEFLTSVGVTIPEKRRKKPEAMKKEDTRWTSASSRFSIERRESANFASMKSISLSTQDVRKSTFKAPMA